MPFCWCIPPAAFTTIRSVSCSLKCIAVERRFGDGHLKNGVRAFAQVTLRFSCDMGESMLGTIMILDPICLSLPTSSVLLLRLIPCSNWSRLCQWLGKFLVKNFLMGQHSGSKAFSLVGAISKKISGALTPVSDISCYATRVPISKTFLLSSLMPLIETAPSAQYKEPFSKNPGRFMPVASSANRFLAQGE